MHWQRCVRRIDIARRVLQPDPQRVVARLRHGQVVDPCDPVASAKPGRAGRRRGVAQRIARHLDRRGTRRIRPVDVERVVLSPAVAAVDDHVGWHVRRRVVDVDLARERSDVPGGIARLDAVLVNAVRHIARVEEVAAVRQVRTRQRTRVVAVAGPVVDLAVVDVQARRADAGVVARCVADVVAPGEPTAGRDRTIDCPDLRC